MRQYRNIASEMRDTQSKRLREEVKERGRDWRKKTIGKRKTIKKFDSVYRETFRFRSHSYWICLFRPAARLTHIQAEMALGKLSLLNSSIKPNSVKSCYWILLARSNAFGWCRCGISSMNWRILLAFVWASDGCCRRCWRWWSCWW